MKCVYKRHRSIAFPTVRESLLYSRIDESHYIWVPQYFAVMFTLGLGKRDAILLTETP